MAAEDENLTTQSETSWKILPSGVKKIFNGESYQDTDLISQGREEFPQRLVLEGPHKEAAFALYDLINGNLLDNNLMGDGLRANLVAETNDEGKYTGKLYIMFSKDKGIDSNIKAGVDRCTNRVNTALDSLSSPLKIPSLG